MLNKSTTSTGLLIFMGMTAFSANISTRSLSQEDYNTQIIIESKNNSPEEVLIRTDKYVNTHYNSEITLANKYTNIDFGLLDIVQNFSQEQISLDKEFSQALDELLVSKINNTPTKKRF